MFRVMIGKVGEPLIASQPHPHHGQVMKMDPSGHFKGVNACTYPHTTFLLTDMAQLRSLQISSAATGWNRSALCPRCVPRSYAV
jgi:hypothetical protein